MSRTLPERTKPGAISASDMCSLPIKSVDDGLDVAQQVVDVKARGDLRGREPGSHRFIRLDQFPQLPALIRRFQRGPLDDGVRVFAREAALLDERGQQATRREQAEAALEVL